MAVPVTPRDCEEVIETTDASPGVEQDVGALNTPVTESAKTPDQSSSDTAGSCKLAAPSTEEGEVDQSVAVKPEVKASPSAAPSGGRKKNRKMKNLVKPAQSPVLGEEQADAPAAEVSGLSQLLPQVEIQTDRSLCAAVLKR
jgi:hypothetical protein